MFGLVQVAVGVAWTGGERPGPERPGAHYGLLPAVRVTVGSGSPSVGSVATSAVARDTAGPPVCSASPAVFGETPSLVPADARFWSGSPGGPGGEPRWS